MALEKILKQFKLHCSTNKGKIFLVLVKSRRTLVTDEWDRRLRNYLLTAIVLKVFKAVEF